MGFLKLVIMLGYTKKQLQYAIIEAKSALSDLEKLTDGEKLYWLRRQNRATQKLRAMALKKKKQ